MSSYLNIYVQRKNSEEKPILLTSYTRSSKVYQSFYDSIHPTFIGMEETQYTTLTNDLVGLVKDDLLSDLKQLDRRIVEYQKHADGNRKIIDEILELLEYKEELECALHSVEFIQRLAQESENSWMHYNLLCNVD